MDSARGDAVVLDEKKCDEVRIAMVNREWMGEAPKGTPGARGLARRAVRASGHRKGQPYNNKKRVGQTQMEVTCLPASVWTWARKEKEIQTQPPRPPRLETSCMAGVMV